MQKVLRQSLLARNKRIKVSHKNQAKKLRDEWKQYDQSKLVADRAARNDIKAERKARREDWVQGPLAPNRNVGLKKGVYGTIHESLARGPELPKTEQTKKKDILFVPGDNVCVVRGSQKGRIGILKEVDLQRGEAIVEGVNMADVAIPKFAPGAQGRDKKYMTSELPLPLEDIRLVCKMEDVDTGRIQDVIIRHMSIGPPYIERPHGSNLPTHTRYVAGHKLKLPWPEDDVTDFSAEPGDTLRKVVDTETWVPRLLGEELPAGVVDELRGKYSKTRDRHDLEWMQQKLLEDAKETWQKTRKLLTPEQEYHETRVKRAAARGRERMSEETKEMIRQTQEMTLRPEQGRKVATAIGS